MDPPHDESDSTYTTPYTVNMNPDSQTWDFTGSPARSERPRASRHSSLPRVLLPSGTSSIFGSGALSVQQDVPEASSSSTQAYQQISADLVDSAPSLRRPRRLAGTEKSRESWGEDDDQAILDRRHIPQVEKDADDPNTPLTSTRAGASRHESTTLTTLSRLFAVRSPTSPGDSRSSSYIQPNKSSSPYLRSLTSETAALPDHLYARGLLEGRHSDITVNAFGHQYRLHRIILDRAPFFRSALSEPWLEANMKETTLHPEDIDPSISQNAFELALKRLYGCSRFHEEERDAVGLFATGCWLEMQDLVDSSIESMLRQMTPESLSPLIRLVTTNYYGRPGDKILASAKSMLCRDGWKMPLKNWDGIPGDIIREIVGGDGFFIDGEWDRWLLSKRILDRRLKLRAIEAGLLEPGSRRKVQKAPDIFNLMAVRFDTVYRKSSIGTGRGVPDNLHRWVMLYTHIDVEPILVLLDEGIHYIHLDFEHLQFIRQSRDVLGLPVLPEKVIGNALWQQMELRQRVMNSRDTDLELDLSVRCTEDAAETSASRDTTMSIIDPSSPPNGAAKGRHKVGDEVPESATGGAEEDMDSGSWDGNDKPRKFWIPMSDCNIVMGGNADPVIATSGNTTLQRHASRLSATVQPEDVQWVSDFAAATSQPRIPPAIHPEGTSPSHADAGIGEVRYTHLPPFRFSAEFPNPRLLKEKKRVYSRTVFYAGSLWNIYIQKVASSRSKQLGVYLHRAKERETEEVIAGTAGLAQGSVDERIGQLEREMILRSERHERRRRRTTIGSDGGEADGAESSGSAGDLDAGSSPPTSSATARANTMRNLLSIGTSQRKSGQTDINAASPQTTSHVFGPAAADGNLTPESDSDAAISPTETDLLALKSKRVHVPALPPYVDARPTILTYFKIYSPSRGGRMLSVYESAPDRFNFSQSWGWKSSTLMLDEGLLGGSGGEEEDVAEAGVKGKEDGKLRFMVVVGLI